MKNILIAVTLMFLCVPALAAQQSGDNYDITNYRIEVQLIPDQHLLRAGADVTFLPLEATRSVIFELNGSLKVESIERNGIQLTNFVQDQVGISAVGPNVRVDLGEVLPANQPVTLRFRWSGALTSPEGGPLATQRLAYVGIEGSYLMYASRWFPFHGYATDRATSDITVIVPTGMQVGGTGDEQAGTVADKNGTTRFRFISKSPVLTGNFVAGLYINQTLRFGNYELRFFVKPGSEKLISVHGELLGKVLEFYTQQYGAPNFGTRFVIAETDNETLSAYSGPGMLLFASKLLDSQREAVAERLQREVAFQWWGQTVGLRSFDDAWLSQGFAEWSALNYREAVSSNATLDSVRKEAQERALLFEKTASIVRAPALLDDQSSAYQSIVLYKGAMVMSILRETLGKENFQQLLKRFLEEYRGKNASLADFERLTSQVAGKNMRYFFAYWLEGTGLPEFRTDYQIIRTKAGQFRTRGTVKTDTEALHTPLELLLRAEGESKTITVDLDESEADFDIQSNNPPVAVVVDPNNRILRMSDDIKVSVIARRGIELMNEGRYSEAKLDLEAALNLDRTNSWVYYNLGLLYLSQKSWIQALDSFEYALNGNLNPPWIKVWAHIKRGNAYDAKGDRTRAVAEYNKAVESGIEYDGSQETAKKFLATPFDPKN